MRANIQVASRRDAWALGVSILLNRAKNCLDMVGIIIFGKPEKDTCGKRSRKHPRAGIPRQVSQGKDP